jgi:hypothetical protein
MTTVNADSDNNIKIYPVPADRFLYIEDHSVNRTAKIQILSVEGKLLIDQLCNGSEIEVIDVSGLSAGIYILKANLGIQSVTRKLIIK